jgi:uncharacterized membrane protein
MSDNPNPQNPQGAIISTAVSAAPKEQPKTLEKFIQEKAPEFLKDIPKNKRAALAGVIVERTEISMRGGPLPDPSELAAYNQTIPNGADRIMKMAEEQSAHRIGIEKTVVNSQQRQAFCGQLFGLIIGLSGLGLATYAAISGQPAFGGIIGSTTLVSLVSSFLFTRHIQNQELTKKREQMRQVEQQMRNRKSKGR